ncbi:unnamed protein product [Callosobruchus maculatus]|uniref:Uncharacterized protein n=1 Tax=Callosobruchus maculatus TaxID=64391 RepID=A0A653CIT8_CALMS|nr:unnamed protein product [Callosobruchus maculatus]
MIMIPWLSTQREWIVLIVNLTALMTALSCGISKLDHVRNDRIREIMNVESTILDTIERKRLLWFGHLQRMPSTRWPKRIWQWTPNQRRKRGRPPRCWKDDVMDSMAARGLNEGDWNDRSRWKLGSERRRQP